MNYYFFFVKDWSAVIYSKYINTHFTITHMRGEDFILGPLPYQSSKLQWTLLTLLLYVMKVRWERDATKRDPNRSLFNILRTSLLWIT